MATVTGTMVDANGIRRLGPIFEGDLALDYTVVARTTDYDANPGDFVAVDASGGDVTVTLPTSTVQGGEQVIVWVSEDPGPGNSVFVDGDGADINADAIVEMAVQFDTRVMVYDDDSGVWAVIASGASGGIFEGWTGSGNPADVSMHAGSLTADDGAGTTAVLDDSGLILDDSTTSTVIEPDLLTQDDGSNITTRAFPGTVRVDGPGDEAVIVDLAGGVTSQPTDTVCFTAGAVGGATIALDAAGLVLDNLGQLIGQTAAAPADGTLAASEFTFWLDATNGAVVFHIKAKQANGTVVGAAIPLT